LTGLTRLQDAEDSSRDQKAGTEFSVRRAIWELAGIVGVHPDPYSIRELEWMGRGRMCHDWNMFAPLICCTANPWLDKKNVLTLEKVHPYFEKKAVKPFKRSDWMKFKAAITGGL